MTRRAFDPARTESAIIDLEGWIEVLDALTASSVRVSTTALGMVACAIGDCVEELRVAAGMEDKAP